MHAIPFALSISHFVNTVGAKAGFAAIIGLAILVLLYFAQARETKSLRDRADAADEHVQQLELYVAQLTRGAGPATPAPGVAPAPASIQRGAAVAAPVAASAMVGASRAATSIPFEAVPAAPAGVAAPSLQAATRLIPSPADGAISIRATGAPAAAAAVATAGAAAATSARASAGGPPPVAPAAGGRGNGAAVLDPPGPGPSTAAGGANGAGRGQIPTPAPAPPPAPPPASVRAAAPPPRPASGGDRLAPTVYRRRIRPGVWLLGGILALAAIVVALVLLTSGGSSSTNQTSALTPPNTSPASTHKKSGRGTLKPADITVAVLNGTSTTNLAHDTGVRLRAMGYKTGTIATATDQTLTATVVAYRPGVGDRHEAVMVARSLGLGPASVQPVDQSNEAVACPQTSTCTAQVVVAVGSDLASTASQTTTASTT
jgi:hypothetical protein